MNLSTLLQRDQRAEVTEVVPLPPGAVRWQTITERLAAGGTRQRLIAVDRAGAEVHPPAPCEPFMPWQSIRHRCRHVVRPFYAAGGVVGVAALADGAHIPAAACAAATVAAATAAHAAAPRILDRIRAYADPDTTTRRRRMFAYITATAGTWITLADLTGLQGHTLWSKLTWTLLPPLAALAAKPYWNHVRVRPAAPEPEVVDVAVVENFGQIIAARWVATVGAVARREHTLPPDVHGADPTVVPGITGGKLPGTVLADIRRVDGGWAADIIDPQQRGIAWTGEAQNSQAGGPARAIAGAFGTGLSAVTLEPYADDANRCFLMIQKSSPLKAGVSWDGPDSIDPDRGVGMFGRYADGTVAEYEVYRPGWGCPHDLLIGTTGAGKSEAFQILMIIDRWMHRVDEHGQAHGMVADFLIDPQNGQSFGPFADNLAAPIAATLDEAMMLAEAFTREMLRRNEYLANVIWHDAKGRQRKGRKWWDPRVDGPILVLNIDEAHYFLSFKPFAKVLTDGARMWRKCGGKLRVGTHTPLLADLGGSMALRDMLTGGSVWVGRTANSLSGPVAFNGQLPVDPKSIPKVPGTAYMLAGEHPRAMLMRTAYEEDLYDWIRGDDDTPIGYPAVIPQVTWDTFGKGFAHWRSTGQLPAPDQPAGPAGSSAPARTAVEVMHDQKAEDVVAEVLLAARGPLDADSMDAALLPYRQQGMRIEMRTWRAAITKLKRDGQLEPRHGSYELTAAAREQMQAERDELAQADR